LGLDGVLTRNGRGETVSDPTPPPPPPPNQETASYNPPAPKAERTWKTWHLAAAVVIALVVGVGIGSAGDDDVQPTASEGASDEEIEALEEQVAKLEQELEERDELLAAAEEALEDEPEPEPEPEPEDADDEDGVYTARDYSFSDVQVSQDFVDDFQVRARATNNGAARQAVIVSATIFSAGSVVGTAQGSVSDWESGQTVTIEMISTDAYTDWDDIEFQIDTEF
jgi:hypothetical protein